MAEHVKVTAIMEHEGAKVIRECEGSVLNKTSVAACVYRAMYPHSPTAAEVDRLRKENGKLRVLVETWRQTAYEHGYEDR